MDQIIGFFLKATVLREIDVPAYTRADGTYIPAHRKHVHVNADVSKEEVISGRGSHSQKEAHRRLSQDSSWHQLDADSRHAHILSLATDIQNERSASAAVSGWKSRAMAGNNPTEAQWRAFYALPNERKEALLRDVNAAAGGLSHLSSPSAPVATEVPSAAPTEAPRQVISLGQTDDPWASSGRTKPANGDHVYLEIPSVGGIAVIGGVVRNGRVVDIEAPVSVAGVKRSYVLSSKWTKVGERSQRMQDAQAIASRQDEHRSEARTIASQVAESFNSTSVPFSSLSDGASVIAYNQKTGRVISASAHGVDVEFEDGTHSGFPVRDGMVFGIKLHNDEQPRDGETKTVDGVQYVLRDGRWHRASADDQSSAPSSRQIISLGERRSAQGASGLTAALSAVPVPDTSTWSSSDTNVRTKARINQLAELARAGDLDAITNFSTSRTRANYRVLDDYRSALLDAAHAGSAAAEAGAASVSIPEPPEITGSNPNNTALIAAKRKVAALYAAAQSSDPVAAILAVSTSRGNGYLNKADDYRTTLLAHFGYSHSGAVVSERAAEVVPSVVSAPAPAPAPAPADRNVPVHLDSKYSFNPEGKSVEELGFYPRPAVPLSWKLERTGVRMPNGELFPYTDNKFKRNVAVYLSQSTSKQIAAKNYQQANQSADLSELLTHPMFADVVAAEQERRAQEVLDAAERRSREEAERRELLASTRSAAASVLTSLGNIGEVLKPKAEIGANVDDIHLERVVLQRLSNLSGRQLSDADVKAMFQLMIADYGGDERFSIESGGNYGSGTVSVNFKGDKGTQITRVFDKDRRGNLIVKHKFFRASSNSQGQGNGKGLFRCSLAVYKHLGVKEIQLYANIDVGGYAWAKYGFIPYDGMGALQLTNKINRLRNVEKTFKNRLLSLAESSDGRAIWAIADAMLGERKIGSELLLGTNWGGHLALDWSKASDPQTGLGRCLAYIAPKPKN